VVLADCVRETLKNCAMAIPLLRKWRSHLGRTGPARPRGPDLDRFAFASLVEVLRTVESVRGLRVLELGPGDHLASGLSFLAAGAESYTAVEPFPGDYRGTNARAWYAAVRAAWHDRFPCMDWPPTLDVGSFPDLPGSAVLPCTIESAQNLKNLGTYHVICSHYVGQHVARIETLSRLTAQHLCSGGVGVHKVGFGPQDCWARYSDPFVFLRFSDRTWRLMGSNRAIPNRRRHHEFVNAFREAGLRVQVRDVIGFQHEVHPSTLAVRFRDMPRSSLGVKEVTYLVRPGI